MSSNVNDIVAKSVWMTKSGYPAIINEVNETDIRGHVISPSGTKPCIWEKSGKNISGHPDFFNLKGSPDKIKHKYAIIKNGALIGSDTDQDSANETGAQNGADTVCRFHDLVELCEKNVH